jgi:hypothetical protein
VPVHPVIRRMASALTYRDFRVLWMGAFASSIGTWMQKVAQSWLVLTLTNSAFYLGLVGLVQFVPALTLTLLGGVVADAYDRRTIMRLAQLPMIASGALLFYATERAEVSLPMLYGAIFCISVSFAFDSPARQALVPSLVPLEIFPRAVTFSATAQAFAFASGPAVGGMGGRPRREAGAGGQGGRTGPTDGEEAIPDPAPDLNRLAGAALSSPRVRVIRHDRNGIGGRRERGAVI